MFDRKVVRFFRKDGHSWARKKDGKTVRETHEKLKVRVALGRNRLRLVKTNPVRLLLLSACLFVFTPALCDSRPWAERRPQVGTVEMLNCYYAHGEADDSFQRRCYWLLNGEEVHPIPRSPRCLPLQPAPATL